MKIPRGNAQPDMIIGGRGRLTIHAEPETRLVEIAHSNAGGLQDGGGELYAAKLWFRDVQTGDKLIIAIRDVTSLVAE